VSDDDVEKGIDQERVAWSRGAQRVLDLVLWPPPVADGGDSRWLPTLVGMARRVGPRTYAPLTRSLAALPVDAVLLPLAAVEQILGTALPTSAQRVAFWSNGQRGLLGRRP
jgi:hypothetical protein